MFAIFFTSETSEKIGISAFKFQYRTKYLYMTLFRNKRFMLDEMTEQNTSKLALFLEYKNLCRFFILCYFIFPPNECLC